MYKKKKFSNEPKPIDPKSAFLKMAKYCSYQDRCESDILLKLNKYLLTDNEKSDIIENLIEEKFLNEERFARSYVRGKFRSNKWGRVKIKQALKMKGIDSYLINLGFEEIKDEEYLQTLYALFDKKDAQEKEQDPYKRKAKIINFLLSKGFESDIVFSVVEECMSDYNNEDSSSEF
ncbi:MAG: RecX family transcriptional regulator [Cytophagales bacterium]|nr:RecX family transcriptional regulator [Cytophagales bacterium]